MSRTKLQGIVEKGGQRTVTQGADSSTYEARTFPGSVVTVYLTGTTTLAAIYSDSIGTSKANPFTAGTDASWAFFVDDGTYDVKFSPSGFSAWTISAITIGGTGVSALAPPPSGGDDYAILQALINTNAPLGISIQLQTGIYLVSAELVLPAGNAIQLVGSPTQWDQARTPSGGTVIRQTGASRSPFKFSGWSHSFEHIRFDGNRLGYAAWIDGWSWGEVRDCSFVNGLIDGAHMAAGPLVNDTNTWTRPYFSGNGTLYVTAGMAANFTSGNRTTITGTCATVSGNTTITMTGAPDLTTKNIRKGDFLIVGPFATRQIIQIESVTANTVIAQTLSANRPTVTASGLDFAIGVGDGYYEEQQSNNNTQTFITPLASGNGGSGLRFNGLYGPLVLGGQTDFNNIFGMSFGGADGLSAIFTAKVIKNYQELNVIGDYYLGSVNGIEIDAPDSSTEPLIAGALLGTGTISHNGYVESIAYGAPQNFIVEVKNNGGTPQHRIGNDISFSSLNTAVDRISNINVAFVNTPNITGGATPFASGAGLNSTTDLIFDTTGLSQNSGIDGTVVIEKPSGGQTFYAALVILTTNVNGVTKSRTALRLLDSTGAAVNWASITAGQSVCVRVNVNIR